jgi:hypothetical protein
VQKPVDRLTFVWGIAVENFGRQNHPQKFTGIHRNSQAAIKIRCEKSKKSIYS